MSGRRIFAFSSPKAKGKFVCSEADADGSVLCCRSLRSFRGEVELVTNFPCPAAISLKFFRRRSLAMATGQLSVEAHLRRRRYLSAVMFETDPHLAIGSSSTAWLSKIRSRAR